MLKGIIIVMVIIAIVLIGKKVVEPTTSLCSYYMDTYGCKKAIINKVTTYNGSKRYELVTTSGKLIEAFPTFEQAQQKAYIYMHQYWTI